MAELDWTPQLDQEFGDEPLLRHLLRDGRYCGIQANMREGRFVCLTLTISFLSKSEHERRRKLKEARRESLPDRVREVEPNYALSPDRDVPTEG